MSESHEPGSGRGGRCLPPQDRLEHSQADMAHVATRAILIRGGGLRYRGSTHCLVSRLEAIADFALAATPQPQRSRPPALPVGTRLAVASPEP